MRNLFVFLALMLVSTIAFAGGPNGNNGGGNNCQGNSCGGTTNPTTTTTTGGVFAGFEGGTYTGTAVGTFDVSTNGGSMAQTGIYENGNSFQFSQNSGGAWAGGTADFSQGSYVGTTSGGSVGSAYSYGDLNGYAGDFDNSTAGGVGSNYETNVTGTWNAVEFGGFAGFAAGTFTGF